MTSREFTSQELLQAPASNETSNKWLAENVWQPFANGTGLIQIHDTFASNAIGTYNVRPAETFSVDWSVQALSTAAGAIVPFVIAGKATGLGLRAAGESLGLQGAAARAITNETLAQVAGAGIYTFAQKPADGQSRLANATGTMAGFAAFAGGNALLSRSSGLLAESAIKNVAVLNNSAASALGTGIGRFAVGAAGGLGAYEATNLVGQLQGNKHAASWDERLQAMAQGGFVNFALPVVREGANKIIDVYDARPSGRGLPVERELKQQKLSQPALQELAHENPLARVKRVEAGSADAHARIKDNAVVIAKNDSPGRLAHELSHLSLARFSEPHYREIAKLAKTNPAAAEEAFMVLRANIEVAARSVENRINATKEHTGRNASQLDTVGRETATGGKTYGDIWKAEWLKFRDNPEFRPGMEYGGLRSIVKATKKYEAWMDDHIDVVRKDLASKHAEMASDPFKFLRGTYYRWAETFPAELPELAKSPLVKSVGDLHVSQFSTWRDSIRRQVWGVNDFDEAGFRPYTNDLVRLVTSAKMLKNEGGLELGMRATAKAVLDGYTTSLKERGGTISLGQHPELRRLAAEQAESSKHYWKKLETEIEPVKAKDLPKDARIALETALPLRDYPIAFGQRQAGVGSLGRERFVAIQEYKGQTYAAEAKAFLPSADHFLSGRDGLSFYMFTAKGGPRSPDPLLRITDGYVVRRLGPEHTKIDLAHVSKVADESRVLWLMGYETANIHMSTKNGAPAILKDLAKRDPNWLVDAARTMSKSTMQDYKDWKHHHND